MNFQLKNLVLPALLTTLVGCGGSDSGSNNSVNQAPEFSMPEMLETEYSTVKSVYDISTDKDVLQVQYTFQESQTFEEGALSIDIDLLKGFTDADDDQNLTIENFKYVWTGPDCSDTIVNAANYPDLCGPILESLGFEIGQTEGITFVEKDIIRKAQNFPVTDSLLFGFELKQTVLTVTPREFGPILFQDEVSLVSFSFDVTDGIDSVTHYIIANVTGENVAPQFLELEEDGSPTLVDGNSVPLAPHSVEVSEKGDVVAVNILEGVYDQDIYNNEAFSREVGDLEEYYTFLNNNSYAIENLGVQTNDISYSGVIEPIGANGSPINFMGFEPVRDPISDKLTGLWLFFDPTVFADQLAHGEEGTVTYNFDVIDGNADNATARTATFVVKGADIVNAPEFSEPLMKSIAAAADIVGFDLLEGVLDLDGDDMEVVDIVTPPEAETFGINVREDGIIIVDPYAFLYLDEGEQEVFNFTYKATDGVLTSEERTFALTINGADVNLLKNGTFDSGLFDNGWVQQSGGAAGTELNAASAYSGSFGVETLVNDSGVRATQDGITQGQITENDSFYVSWQSKSRPASDGGTGAWTNVVLLIKNAFDNSNVHDAQFSTMRGVYSQVLHTVDYAPDNFFAGDTPFELDFTAKQSVTIDDVKLVKYRSNTQRNIVDGNDGHFNAGTAANWMMSAPDASIAITEDANMTNSQTATLYGLEATSGASWNALRLMPAGIDQGTFKKGIRYVVEFDFQNTGGPEALEVKLIDQTSGNYIVSPKNQISVSPTQWQNLRFHFVTDTDSTYFNGAIASDPDFDWSLADDVRLEVVMAPNTTFNIDNVRIYPVPE